MGETYVHQSLLQMCLYEVLIPSSLDDDPPRRAEGPVVQTIKIAVIDALGPALDEGL